VEKVKLIKNFLFLNTGKKALDILAHISIGLSNTSKQGKNKKQK